MITLSTDRSREELPESLAQNLEPVEVNADAVNSEEEVQSTDSPYGGTDVAETEKQEESLHPGIVIRSPQGKGGEYSGLYEPKKD